MKRAAILLMLLAVSLVAQVPQISFAGQSSAAKSFVCADLNDPSFDTVDWGGIALVDVKAGETITITGDYAEVEVTFRAAAAITILLQIDGVYADTDGLPGTLSHTFTSDGLVLLNWSVSTEMYVNWNVSCTSGAEDEAPAPGCDVQINLPTTSVVGAFVGNAQTYWAADLNKATANPSIVIPAGKTAWVLGIDSSQQFYKILWSCTLLWVPTSTMGPNYDLVWNGRPLPTNVVN